MVNVEFKHCKEAKRTRNGTIFVKKPVVPSSFCLRRRSWTDLSAMPMKKTFFVTVVMRIMGML